MAVYPITAYKGTILQHVAASPVTIVTAETGAGKSTQIPQFLLEAGYRVLVTQPRRLAARMLAERVAEEHGTSLGTTIGYQTAEEKLSDTTTQCLFVTDGLAMIRELLGGNAAAVLVIDEVHEWNINVEVLVAWVKRQLGLGESLKVVIMSATLDADGLSAFFDGAPVVDVPGRLFPVEVVPPQHSVVTDTLMLVKKGHNVLVFQPGKSEITETLEDLKASGLRMAAYPLHADLSKAEQQKCFQHTRQPKVVVATTIAQTSLTIDDITAVVDSGTERRIETVDGIEGLYLLPISEADSSQRKGRAGRTAPGIYIDHCPVSDRPEFSKPEILRRRLDQTVLRLASIGIDAAQMVFFHSIEHSVLEHAKRSLQLLGCLDTDGRLTTIGREVSRIPIDVRLARMIVEGRRLGVEPAMVAIAALTETKGFGVRVKSKLTPAWHALCNKTIGSDMIAWLAIYFEAHDMNAEAFYSYGLHRKSYLKTIELHRRILRQLGQPESIVIPPDAVDLDKIKDCICVGLIEHLHLKGYGTGFSDSEKRTRMADQFTTVRTDTLVVGLPFDLEIKQDYGTKTLNILQQITNVTLEQLRRVVPSQIDVVKNVSPDYDPWAETIRSVTQVWCNGLVVAQEHVVEPVGPENAHIKAACLEQEAKDKVLDRMKALLWNYNRTKPASVIARLNALIHHDPALGDPLSSTELTAIYEWALMTCTAHEAELAQTAVVESAKHQYTPTATAIQRPLGQYRAPVTVSSIRGVKEAKRQEVSSQEKPENLGKSAMELAFEAMQQKKVTKSAATSSVSSVKKPTPAPLPEKKPVDLEARMRALQAKYQRQ